MTRPPVPAGLLPRLAAILATTVVVGACTGASPSPSASVGASPSVTASDEPSPSSEPSEAAETPGVSPADRLRLELVADRLVDPIGITSAGDGSGRLFVNERGGRIVVIGAGGQLRSDPFVDLSSRILAGDERGLLGVAFHPNFAVNRRLFVHYSRAGDGATVVSELRASADLGTADPGSERVLLTVAQPFANHNGGQLAFGPDGYLYLGLGDGGSGGDPLGNGQNPGVLLGKILRLDVDGEAQGGRAYAIPRDNPYAAGGSNPRAGLPEIWAIGLRNPWRFSFDAANGDLYIADVGQGSWEEIDRQPADSTGGENYGWNVFEASTCYAGPCDAEGFVAPIAEYGHDQGCSVTGGYVYRGAAQPALSGLYIFSDYCSGIFFSVRAGRNGRDPKLMLDSDFSVSSFGVGEDGELYVADIAGGGIYHVLAD